jgi:protein PhnA
MPNETPCPKCRSESTYENAGLWTCLECSHEWNEWETAKAAESEKKEEGARDAFGNALSTGDSVTVIKDLKVKGSTSVVKVGTKVKNIRIVDSTDGHNIACRIEGIGAMNLKSEFVKKA